MRFQSRFAKLQRLWPVVDAQDNRGVHCFILRWDIYNSKSSLPGSRRWFRSDGACPRRPEPKQNVPCVRFKTPFEAVNVALRIVCSVLTRQVGDRSETIVIGSLASRHLDVSGGFAFEFSHSTGSLLEGDGGLCVFDDLQRLAIT